MKKFLTTFLATICMGMIMPSSLSAQPKGEGWISLRDYASALYQTSGSIYNTLPKGNKDYLSIKKIAYKNLNKKNQEKKGYMKLGINPWPYIGKEGSKEFESIDVYGDFTIAVYNPYMKIKANKLRKDEDGWIYYDMLPEPSFIEYLNLQYDQNGNIWDNIYVVPGDMNYIAFVEDVKRQREEKTKKQQQQKMQQIWDQTFTTAAEKGKELIKSETLRDGTKVDYYEGYRQYTKPNGDFASFVDGENYRDPKTLEMVYAYNQPLDNKSELVGAYQITLPSGMVLSSDGRIDKYYKKNEIGDTLVLKEEFYDLEKNFIRDRKQKQTINKKDNLIINKALSFATFENFMDPSTIKKLIFRAGGASSMNVQLDHEVAITQKEGEWPLTLGLDESTAYDNERNMLLIDDNNIIYEFTENGLEQKGIQLRKGFNLIYDSNLLILWTRNSMKNKNLKNGIIVEFNNGDILNCDYSGEEIHDSRITLDDGAVMEVLENSSLVRISYPDGSVFTGRLQKEPIKWIGMYNLGKFPERDYDKRLESQKYLDGILTMKNGTKYDFESGRNDAYYKWQSTKGKTKAELAKEKAEDAKRQAEYQKKTVERLNAVGKAMKKNKGKPLIKTR